jgi:hypothetical protein
MIGTSFLAGASILALGAGKGIMALSVVAQHVPLRLRQSDARNRRRFQIRRMGNRRRHGWLSDTTLFSEKALDLSIDERHAHDRHELGSEQLGERHGFEHRDDDADSRRHGHRLLRRRPSADGNGRHGRHEDHRAADRPPGGAGTYTVDTSQTVSSTTITGTGSGDVHQVLATLTATGAGTVTNAGTFDNSTIGSGNLGLKGDFTGVPLKPAATASR